MKNIFLRGFTALSLGTAALATMPSCTKDLDRTPFYDPNPALVYKDAAGYKQVMAKIYGGFALTGTQGPSGDGTGDIQGIDEGTSDYLRQFWSAQELSTDEAVITWGDPGIQDWHNMNWNSGNVLIRGLYSRIFYEITLCNGFLAEATDDKLSSRGISGADLASVKNFRAEVRFIRALSYYHALDLFGNVPFATETDAIGGFTPPKAITRSALYDYVESELKAIDTDLVAPRQNEFARADKAAAWTLLARLYLNASVYKGAPVANAYTNAATYAKKVIDAGYALQTTRTASSSAYGRNFLTDNGTSPENIFMIAFDGRRTQSYGGTTFLVHGSVSGTADANWNPAKYGIGGGWGGMRATSKLFEQFADTAADRRARFQTGGQTKDIVSLTDFRYGFVPIKWKNVSSAGVAGSDNTFVDTDFPMFRLADVYLMYSEAVSRGGTGDATLALKYVNDIRDRAYQNPTGGLAGHVTAATLTANNFMFFLDERSRELFWEGQRRTDLIRFGKFTDGSYLWPWKGGAAAGVGVAAFRNLYPIPSSDLSSNPNLTQNTGY